MGYLAVQGIFGGGRVALTDIEIRKAKTLDKAYRVCDGSGLFLWVMETGGKLWRWSFVTRPV